MPPFDNFTVSECRSIVSFLKKINAFPLFLLILFSLRIVIPLQPGYELSTDEGINVMKSVLFMHGFSLYDQIWSDQPPLFTYIQACWFSVFGTGLVQGRFLVLFFSAVLSWLLCQIVSMEKKIFAGLGALVLLLCSADFLLCSMKIMIGVPALALALLAVYFFYIYHLGQGNRSFLLLSAFVLALSVATKMFTLLLVPAFLVEIIRGQWASSDKGENIPKKVLEALLLWGGAFFAGIAVVLYITAPNLLPDHLGQIFLPHTRLMERAGDLHWDALHQLARTDYDFVALAILGVSLMLMKRNFSFIFPLIWLVTSVVFLLHHNPIWHHHYLLISIPLVWLTALGISEIDFRPLWHFFVCRMKFSPPFKPLIAPALFCLIIFLALYHLPKKIDRLTERFPDYQSEIDQDVIRTMARYGSQTRWLVTDRPVYPFVAQLLVPPELAVFSLKRFNSGFLDVNYILKVIEQYKPEQILFGRFNWIRREVGAYLEKDYQKVISRGGVTLLVRKDLLSS